MGASFGIRPIEVLWLSSNILFRNFLDIKTEKNITLGLNLTFWKGNVVRTGLIESLDESPDKKYLVTASWDGAPKVWSHGGRYVTTLASNPDQRGRYRNNLTTKQKGHSLSVISVKFDPDMNFVITTSLDKTIKTWNYKTGELIKTLKTKSPVLSVEYLTDKRQMLVSYDDGSFGIWDYEKEKELIRSYIFDNDPNKWVHVHPLAYSMHHQRPWK